MEDSVAAYTFVCLADNQVATLVDVQALGADAIRGHALNLLREHASAVSVEVWQDDGVIALIQRDGLRASARPVRADEQDLPAASD